MENQNKIEHKIGYSIQRPWYFYRWWMKCETITLDKDKDGFMHGARFYCPWWAWGFELLHRAVFGKIILEPLE